MYIDRKRVVRHNYQFFTYLWVSWLFSINLACEYVWPLLTGPLTYHMRTIMLRIAITTVEINAKMEKLTLYRYNTHINYHPHPLFFPYPQRSDGE